MANALYPLFPDPQMRAMTASIRHWRAQGLADEEIAEALIEHFPLATERDHRTVWQITTFSHRESEAALRPGPLPLRPGDRL